MEILENLRELMTDQLCQEIADIVGHTSKEDVREIVMNADSIGKIHDHDGKIKRVAKYILTLEQLRVKVIEEMKSSRPDLLTESHFRYSIKSAVYSIDHHIQELSKGTWYVRPPRLAI